MRYMLNITPSAPTSNSSFQFNLTQSELEEAIIVAMQTLSEGDTIQFRVTREADHHRSLEERLISLVQQQGMNPIRRHDEWALYIGEGFLNLSTIAKALEEPTP